MIHDPEAVSGAWDAQIGRNDRVTVQLSRSSGRVPVKHPLRTIPSVLNAAFETLDDDFEGLYANEGRPSIPPERLVRASFLQTLFSIRSERQLMEQPDYNLLLLCPKDQQRSQASETVTAQTVFSTLLEGSYGEKCPENLSIYSFCAMIKVEQGTTRSPVPLSCHGRTEPLTALIQAFPDRRDDFERLRSSNLVFDEICRDCESLSGLLTCDAIDPSLRDIQQSLSGFKMEIQGFPRLASPHQSSRSGKSLNPTRAER